MLPGAGVSEKVGSRALNPLEFWMPMKTKEKPVSVIKSAVLLAQAGTTATEAVQGVVASGCC